ncbi:MAG: STAS domain-containing protein [Coxiellaceae bacterium]|nr:STAS domain-containing protein [Coxiellaceae bacterium]
MQNPARLISNETGFTLEGPVSFASVVALRALGEQLIEKVSCAECVIDLSGLQNQDASMFSLLLCWIRLAEKKGLKIKFISASPTFLRMQHLFGLEKVWTNY